jgi:hypothetical protein
LFLEFGKIFEKLFPSYTSKLWRFTFNVFTSYYIQFIIYQSYNYNQASLSKMLEKVKQEVELIQIFGASSKAV